MNYVKLAENNTAIIGVQGPWTLIQGLKVKEEAASVYMKGINTFIVDFQNTTFIDSSSIQELVTLRRKVGEDNFWVINPQGEVYKALKAPKLTDWIKE